MNVHVGAQVQVPGTPGRGEHPAPLPSSLRHVRQSHGQELREDEAEDELVVSLTLGALTSKKWTKQWFELRSPVLK